MFNVMLILGKNTKTQSHQGTEDIWNSEVVKPGNMGDVFSPSCWQRRVE